MFKALKTIFEESITGFSVAEDASHSLELASAALLFEISQADEDVSAIEKDQIAAALRKVFSLGEQELADLMAAADAAVGDAVSLYDFTAVVNDQFTREQKIQLIEMLWRVAFADEVLDQYEEYYVRKIAELLHVSHKDYIQTKLRVQDGR
ncbi:MAG: TerB family tellurite resistance protein [Pseudomonadota bacterium]